MKCIRCELDFDESDMTGELCDNCFDRSMEIEDRHIAISSEQNNTCFICKKDIVGSILKKLDGVERVICWPSCNDKMNEKGPLRLDKNSWNLQLK